MSLFETASLVVTPNGTKASKLYAVKPTNGSGDLSVTRATTATRVNSSGLIESVSSNVPRLDYTGSTCPSILVEPQRTNIALYSEQFDNAGWIKGSSSGTITVTANQTTAPDGNNTADKIVFPNTTSGNFSVITFPFTTSASSYSGSFYFKGLNGGETIWISFTKDGINYNRKICNLTTSWQRFDLSALLTVGADNFQFGVDTRDSSQSPKSSQTIFVWGAQLEVGSYATSYIPTTSASVTRNVDIISKTGLTGISTITETFENGTTNIISGSPTSYTMSQGRIKQVIGI